MESNIYLGYTMDAADSNMSNFFQANSNNLQIIDSEKLINDSPNPDYFGVETKIENLDADSQEAKSGENQGNSDTSPTLDHSFKYDASKILFRYVVVGCAFYSNKEKPLVFHLSVDDSAEAREKSHKEGESIYTRFENTSVDQKTMVRPDFEDIQLEKYTLSLKGGQNYLRIETNQKIEISCSPKIKHTVVLIGDDQQKMIWVEDVTSFINYKFPTVNLEYLIQLEYYPKENDPETLEINCEVAWYDQFAIFEIRFPTLPFTNMISNFLGYIIFAIIFVVRNAKKALRKKKLRLSRSEKDHIKIDESDLSRAKKSNLESIEEEREDYEFEDEDYSESDREESRTSNSLPLGSHSRSNEYNLPSGLQIRYCKDIFFV